MFEKIRLKMSGSVLIFTLLLLSIALVAALSLATAVVVGTKSAGDTNKSVQAFQTADSGVEAMLQKIKNANSDDSLASIGCGSGNKATGDIRSGNSTYEVTFYDSEEPANVLDCSKKISDIAKIKSVGKFGGAIRAVETAVAAGGSGITGSCVALTNDNSGSTAPKQPYKVKTIEESIWGNGCRNIKNYEDVSVQDSYVINRCFNVAEAGYECGAVDLINEVSPFYGHIAGSSKGYVCVCVEN